ncbi:MAG: hypothetical protein GX649_00220, partial [Chloroflexi bacterium]|nr:hypothetical protein [Chloroflexota bacterium]
MGVGRVAVLRADTLEPVVEVPLGGLGYPQGLTVDPESGRLYVAHALAPKYGALTAIDLDSLAVVGTLTGDHRAPLQGARQVWVHSGGEELVLATGDGLALVEGAGLSLRDVQRAAGGLTVAALDPLEGVAYTAGGGGLQTRRVPGAGRGVAR